MKRCIIKLSIICYSVIFICGCGENNKESKFSSLLKKALIEYENESKRVGNYGNLEVKYLTKGDSIALNYVKNETKYILWQDSVFKSFMSKLSEPEILDTTIKPKYQIIRLLYLGLDDYDDPEVFSFCYRIDISRSRVIRKKFKIDLIRENGMKYKLKNMPLKIHEIDSVNISLSQIKELKHLLEINDYWLLDKSGSFGTCSANTWYVETLLDNVDFGLPIYKKLRGTTKGSMGNVVKYILEM